MLLDVVLPDDDIALTDEVETDLVYAVAPSDTVAVTDDVVREAEINVVLAGDAIALTDTIHLDIIDVAVSDAISVDYEALLVELLNTASVYDVTLDEQVDTPDFLLEETDYVRFTTEDALDIEDEIVPNTNYVRSITTDDLFANDELIAATNYTRDAGEDSVAITDEIHLEVDASSNDNISVTDQVTPDTSYVRNAQDAISVTDQTLVETTFPQDAISVTDTITPDTSYVRSANDTIAVTDQIFPDKVFERSGSDTISVTDERPLVETIFPQDTISVTDTTTIDSTSDRTLADALTVTEQLIPEAFYDRAVFNSIVVTDDVTALKLVLYDVSIDETAISVTDTVLAEPLQSRDVSDTISVTDSVSRDVPYVRTVQDAIVITEQLIPSTFYIRDAGADAIAVTDSVDAQAEKGRSVQDTISVTDQLSTVTDYVRTVQDSIVVLEQLVVVVQKAFAVDLNDTIDISSEFVLAEVIDVDVDIDEAPIFVIDSLLVETNYVRSAQDAITVTDTILAKLGGEVDRDANDTISVTDEVSYILIPGAIEDEISVTDIVAVEVFTPLPIVMDADGFGLTLTLSEEIRYDRIQDPQAFRFRPLPGRGVLFQSQTVEPIVTVNAFGTTGEVAYQDDQNFFSHVFRTSGANASSSSSVSGNDVTVDEAVAVSDFALIELIGASPVTYGTGFTVNDENGYIEITNGLAPGVYRIVDVLDPNTVVLDAALPVVDVENGILEWQLTTAVQALHFRLTNKATNQENYELRGHDLLARDGSPFAFTVPFFTQGIAGPRVTGASATDEGVVEVLYDQEMQSDRAFVFPGDYAITGPSTVRINRAWSTGPSSVALEAVGLESGSYLLSVNYAATPKDVAGNPIDPTFNSAIFTGSIPLKIRSVFTDKGPIAKPPLVLQSGFGATLDSITEVTLPGAALNTTYIGRYVRLGPQGLEPTTSSSVIGTDVTINDTVYVSEAIKVELNSKVVYTTLRGTYKIVGVLTTSKVKLQASFTIPDMASGALYWEVFDPRDGEIADDPSDVVVKVNGTPVVPDAVIGLLGQVVLNAIPAPADDVKIDYSWVCNPVVELRRLNSREFRLNSWDRDVTHDANPTQHKYRYNNTLVRPSDYEPLNMLATLDQPENRELHYRAYERAYTPVLNDPTLLLLNSPIHKIAFPPAQRTVSEEFITYEATALPENDLKPWVRHGVGAASVLAGVLTVVDNTSGPFPFGQPIFWTKAIDLTFPNAFAMSWRFQVDPVVPIYDGVFTGVAAGYTDDLNAYVVGFLNDGGTRKIAFLKRGVADDPSLVTSWTGGIDSGGSPTGLPADFDWAILHSYRIFKDLNGTVRLFVDGNVVETLRITPVEAPFLEELNSPFNEIQGVFFGSLSRQAESTSHWDFVRYLILPTNPIQTSPSSFVSYEATVPPEIDTKPWTPIGFHGTETIISDDFLLLDSTSATDAATEAQVALMGGDFKGFVRMEPLLNSASQVVVDVNVQLRTYTHGVDPYGLMFAVDDGSRLAQVSFLAHRSTPKFSYGGRSFPEDFSPYAWSFMGTGVAKMEGRILRITDAAVGDGLVYFIDDVEPPASDNRVIAAGIDYFLEFRNKVISYTVDGSGFAGAFAQIFDGNRSVGLLFAEIAGMKLVYMHSDGVFIAPFEFDWGDGEFHTYRLAKNTTGNLVSLFIDGEFIGSNEYSDFVATVGTAMVSFGSSTPASSASLSEVDWAYCNAWRTRSDIKHYVGIWKGYDPNSLTGFHLPLKAFGTGATAVGNVLGDSEADFLAANVLAGDALIVDFGPNKGVYEVAAVINGQALTIVGAWPFGPTTVDYRVVKETDWTVPHKYRLTRDTTGEVALLFETDPTPLIRIGYNSIDLPSSGSGIVKTLSNGLAAIAFGSFSPENLEQSYWDFVRYGITRSPTELRIAPHHQFLNQWNVMESPERLYTALPHELTSFKSSSTGIVPKKDPDFLRDPGLPAFTQLNDSTPLVPSTQTFEVRGPFPVQEYVSALNNPEDVLNNDGDFTLNDSTIHYRLIVPDDVLYTSLDVIEQVTGEEDLIAPFGECCGPAFSGFEYQKEVCLTYDADSDLLPENDTSAPTPWVRESDFPIDVTASVAAGTLTYRTTGSKTVYKNNTTLPDAPGLQTEAKFRLRLVDDATLGTGDTQVRFGLSAPGLTIALAFVTSPIAERYVLVVDLNNGAYLGAVSFDFLDGNFHDYRITRDPGAGLVRVSIDS